MKKIILTCIVMISFSEITASDKEAEELVKDFYTSAKRSMLFTVSRYTTYYGIKMLSIFGLTSYDYTPETLNSFSQFATPIYWFNKYRLYSNFLNNPRSYRSELGKKSGDLLWDITEFLKYYFLSYLPETHLVYRTTPTPEELYSYLQGAGKLEVHTLFFVPLFTNIVRSYNYMKLLYRARNLVTVIDQEKR